jgi:hypothetical protein
MAATKAIHFSARKFQELIVHIATRSKGDPRFGATKLNKILYFADFAAYRRLGRPITGARYQRLEEGPAPRQLLPARERMLDSRVIQLEQHEYFWGVQQRVVPLREPDLSVFSEEELAIVDEVIKDLWPFNAQEVSRMAHNEPGWRLVGPGDDIPYKAAWLSSAPLTAEEEEFGRQLAERLGR